MKRSLRVLIGVGGGVFLAIFLMAADVQFRFASRIFDPTNMNLKSADVAMILGASITSDATPSDALRDRLIVGTKLYRDHIVKKILLTGDDGANRANEIRVMKSFAMAQGVPETDILVDGQGYRTYESCKHAAKTFHLSNAIIVTQRFHMSRALYLCNKLGVPSTGVTSDLQSYKRIFWFWTRDLAASVEAWWDVNIWTPKSPVSPT